jgi:hypothetical protein
VVITIHDSSLRRWRKWKNGRNLSLKWLDGLHVYEINKSEGLYLETSLQMLSEYDGKLMEKEQIDIEYKYFFGDLVQVKGYGSDLFKVVGFRTEIWRYKEDAWEDVIYELSRIKDGEWLEAGEEELTLVADSESADTFIQKLGLLFSANKEVRPSVNLDKKSLQPRAGEKEELRKINQRRMTIDHLLDIYNDYRILYKWFNDDEYAHVMRVIIRKLSLLVNNDGKSHV